MFFATLIAVPILAGLVAGVLTGRRTAPWILSGLCVVLGALGAIAIGIDSDTTDRASSVAFSIGAGIVGAALVWAGFGLARIGRRSASHA